MLLNFSKPYMGSLESPCIKVIPPPPTTTTTGVTSRPAGLRPQVKRGAMNGEKLFVVAKPVFLPFLFLFDHFPLSP